MGIFTSEDQRGDTYVRWGRVGSTAAASVVSLATAFSSFYIVQDREVALKIRFGAITDVQAEPGLYAKVPFIDGVIRYPLFRQRTEVLAEDANLRTRDQMRVEGGIYVDYEIDEASTNIESIYADLRGDSSDIQDVIRMRAREAAVRAFGEFSSTDLTSQIDQITARAQVLLQESIDEQGWPFKVLEVVSNGVRLSPDSEVKLERVMAAEQERIVLELRQRNAALAVDVLKIEGTALGGLYNELANAGVPPDQINTLICLKMANDADSVQVALAPGCFPDLQRYDVAVMPQGLAGATVSPTPAQP